MSEAATLEFMKRNRHALVAERSRDLGVVRDYVRGVGRHYSAGIYLHGPPGTAKTHVVLDVLRNEIQEVFAYVRGHLTPLGLFDLLREHPDEVIVLDDVSKLLRSETALQILLAALEGGSKPRLGRRVEYRRLDRIDTFYFRGGIICISNLELRDEALLSPLRSRFGQRARIQHSFAGATPLTTEN